MCVHHQLEKCDECGKETEYITICTFPDRDDEERLCPACLEKAGHFCLSCGMFCAGIESFDIIHPGYCDYCWDQLKELPDDEEDWEPNDFEGYEEDD